MAERLPPIHDVARFWHPTKSATLKSCAAFLGKDPLFWNLHWLRDWAARIVSREVTPLMLRQAVKSNVPEKARSSVNRAIELFLKSIDRHAWEGEPLFSTEQLCKNAYTTVQPIGIYRSKLLKSKFVLALQPRSEAIPSIEQMRIWYSALHHNYAAERDASVMIIDLAKNLVSERRDLTEFGPDKLSLLSTTEIQNRLASIEEQFFEASKLAPKNKSDKKRLSNQEKFKF